MITGRQDVHPINALRMTAMTRSYDFTAFATLFLAALPVLTIVASGF